MLTRTQKEAEVADLRDKLSRSTSVFVADYRGVTVQQIDGLRSQLKQESGGNGAVEYRVAKNTLLRRAAAGTPVEALQECFSGPTAIAISFGDPVAVAKALVEYQKKHEVFELKGGFLEGRTLERPEIETLATLPSLDELRGQLVGLVQAPATKLVRLLSEPGSQLARLLEARRAVLEESTGG